MRIPRIFIEQSLEVDASTEIEGSQAHYLSKVLRLEKTRELIVFNGKGGEYHAEIINVSKKSVTLIIHRYESVSRESPLLCEIAIGLSKGERMDYVVQKSTELGVSKITPLFTERTEVKLTQERALKKQAHWRSISISACEQCGRTSLPHIALPVNFEQYIKSVTSQRRFVLHHRSDIKLTEQTAPQDISLIIGPEGGLSAREIRLATHQGFQPLTLGPRVMRTETAPIAALTLMQYLWGDLS